MGLQNPHLIEDASAINALAGFIRDAGFVNLAFAGDTLNAANINASTIAAASLTLTGALGLVGPLTLTGPATAAQPLLDVVGTTVAANASTVYAEAAGVGAGSAALQAARNRTAAAGAGQYLANVILDLTGHAADAASAPTAIHVRALSYNGGAPLYQALYLEGASGRTFNRALAVVDSPCTISSGNVTLAIAEPVLRIQTDTALAGELSARIVIATGDSPVQARNIELSPGIDTVGADHGSVLLASRAAGQIPIQVQAIAGQTANLLAIQNSAAYNLAVIDATGNIVARPISVAAGAASTQHVWRTNTSAAEVAWSAGSDGEAATANSNFFLTGPTGAALRLDQGAAGNIVRFFAGAGVTPAVRAGQLADATTGAAGAQLDAMAGTGADALNAAQAAIANANFKRILDRLNALEAIVFNVGWSTV